MSGFSRGSLRLYYERRAKSYLLINHSFASANNALRIGESNGYEAIGEIMQDNDPLKPCLGSTSVSWQHLHNKCTRVSWAQLPDVWQKALSAWLDAKPEIIRGFWRTEELKVVNTPREDLPLLIGTFKSLDGQRALEARLKKV